MCDADGVFVGWALIVATCDGDTTLSYIDEDGGSPSATLPAGWKPCVQGEEGPEWAPSLNEEPYSATVDIDFAAEELVDIDDVSGNITLTGSNYAVAREIKVRLVETGASSRTITLPTGWKKLSDGALTLGSLKTGVLILTSWGTTEADVTVFWEVT